MAGHMVHVAAEKVGLAGKDESQAGDGPAVRFASMNEEIEPSHSVHEVASGGSGGDGKMTQEMSPKDQEEIRSLAMSLQKSRLQQQRMTNYAFEPVSLPPSRSQSRDSSPHSQNQVRSGYSTPRASPPVSRIQSPPLTPSASGQDGMHDAAGAAKASGMSRLQPEPDAMTPQASPPHDRPAAKVCDDNVSIRDSTSRPSTSSLQNSTRPTSVSDSSVKDEETQKRGARFSLASDSASPREQSPLGTPRHGSVPTSPTGSRPGTPGPPTGDPNDPYGRSKRPAQPLNQNNSGQLEQRFVFGPSDAKRKSGPTSPSLGSTQLPRSGSGADLRANEKRGSGVFPGKKDPYGHLQPESGASTLEGSKPHGSMSELKRFFRIGHKHKDKEKRARSPAPSVKKEKAMSTSGASTRSGAETPPHQFAPAKIPFADDHGLQQKYGKIGKMLGSGAGGSVRLIKRSNDNTTFAVKQFRDRHTWETEKEYSKKVTAEFCIGSTLHHGNIIETMDIIHEHGHWYEVMEYAPFDLFAIVMTGKMSREEVACSFLQIVNGVSYLHEMGLAHRDLKLDNVVVNENGIMKLIDFGSACVYRYPFEHEIVLASGIVGSDPYLAPEVYDEKKYDPRGVDVWSLAIIFCCMSLRRFPWKAPRLTDNSYKLFVSPPTPGTPNPEEIRRASEHRAKSADAKDDSRRQSAPNPGSDPVDHHDSHGSHHHHHHKEKERPKSDPPTRDESNSANQSSGQKQEVVKGPWRLLRILPRESRHIIGRMLRVEPAERATLEEVYDDEWISSIAVCSQQENGQIYRAPGHDHTLEPGSPPTPAPSKGK